MNLVIRPATPDDAEKIAAYNVALARESEGRPLNRRTVLTGVRALLAEPNYGFYIVADTGKKIVGMLLITFEWSDWLNQMWWWLQSVYVEPKARRLGVFTRLHSYIIERAQAEGTVAGIRLYAEKGNKTALKTYAGIGLQKTSYCFLEGELPGNKPGPKKERFP